MMAHMLAVLLLAVVAVHSAPRCDINLDADCNEVYNISQASGVYPIYPFLTPVQVYCDMNTDGGKWTVIQRRIDGSLNFYRPWNQYKVGFGNPEGEYWLGLENIHLLTKRRKYELRVDMEDFEGNSVFAMYSSFYLDSEADGYKLHVTGFTNGGAGDSLAYHSGSMFSTFDKDQDTWSDNCAATYYGAFWYGSCHHANINGEYLWGTTKHFATSVNWNHWKGYHYSLKAVSMKIRPVP
ncbi:microfibril-associated glycoprotein 4 [Salmo trutta]|uniref:Microfibril associated protein 4 n=1 Tax=Salmo trutta TaxID=8032 RepID=A0A673VXV6_SALTR|nr:microfibril-associated glycoprotein 4-like [Salmo trutta]